MKRPDAFKAKELASVLPSYLKLHRGSVQQKKRQDRLCDSLQCAIFDLIEVVESLHDVLCYHCNLGLIVECFVLEGEGEALLIRIGVSINISQ